VTGKRQSRTNVSSMTAFAMFAQSEVVSKLWELGVLGIQDPNCEKNNEEMEMTVPGYLLNAVQLNDKCLYELRLPWTEGHPPIQRNFNLAKKI